MRGHEQRQRPTQKPVSRPLREGSAWEQDFCNNTNTFLKGIKAMEPVYEQIRAKIYSNSNLMQMMGLEGQRRGKIQWFF